MSEKVRVVSDIDTKLFQQLAKRARSNERTIAAEIRVAIAAHLDKPALQAR